MACDVGVNKQQIVAQIASSYSKGDFREAERLCRQLLKSDNADAQALHLLAQVVNQQGRYAEAIGVMEKLLALDPMQPSFYNDYGVMLASLDRWAEAETAYRMALVLDGTGVDARFNLALALFRQKKTDEALQVLDLLENRNPDFAEQYELRGEILQSAKRHAEAVLAFSKGIERGLQGAEILVNLGTALSDAGSKDEAFALLAKSGELDSEDAAVNFYLGNLFREQGALDDAAKYFRKAVDLFPEFAEAHNNLGLVLQAQGDDAGAEAAFAQALSAAPGLGAVHNNMGNARLKQGQMELALACFKKAVELSPASAEAWNNLGETYFRLQRLIEAEGAYRQALALKPDSAEAELNLGILLLLRGDFSQGWKGYEKRWEMPLIRDKRPRFARPEWAGEPLDGKVLLIYVEQGMGDNLQFVRYLRVLRDRYPAARIYYWGLRPLARLLADYAASCSVELLPETIPGGVPPIDYHIALLSIPRLLGTTLETIPAEVPYLKPHADLVEKWGLRLAGLKGKKVGLVWASGETYLFHMFRTMQLRQLKPLLDVEGVTWISLQKGSAAGQIAEEGLSDKIFNLMDDVEDFADTAAVIANLDLVISVDTSVPHLAGAMGVPVWLLDRFDTDWRWLLNRTDSPWYPTMRIFRQSLFGDWTSVAADVTNALQELASSSPSQIARMPNEMNDFGNDRLRYRLVRARHGWMLANPSDFYIGQALIEYGEYNELEAEFLLQCFVKPGRIIEVGANVGSHSVGLAKAAAARGERMEVFEPQPVIFQNLCANLALNGLVNVRAWPFACADEAGTVSFDEPDYGCAGNFGGVSMQREVSASGRRITVPCVRLDDVLGDDPVSLVKIDVEGFELSVLQGAAASLVRWQPILYVENDRVEASRTLIEWLWEKGYRLFWHVPPLFNSQNFCAKTANRFGNVASFNMLCMPVESPIKVDGMEEIVDASLHPLGK